MDDHEQHLYQALTALRPMTAENLKKETESYGFVDWVNVTENDHAFCVRWGESEVYDGGGRIIVHKN